jgi:hypothetical protein
VYVVVYRVTAGSSHERRRTYDLPAETPEAAREVEEIIDEKLAPMARFAVEQQSAEEKGDETDHE